MFNDIKIDKTCQNTFDFIFNYATKNDMQNTIKSLRVAVKLHKGQERNDLQMINGVPTKVPYVYHCLQVCNSLIEHSIPFSKEDLDKLYAAALLHDTIEDCKSSLQQGGVELVSRYRVDKEVYEIIKLLTKPKNCTEEEMANYFNNIKQNKMALLIKIADRNNNVSDLYNMRDKRLKKYIEETKNYVIPLCTEGRKKYPEVKGVINIYKSSITALINSAEKFLEKENEIQMNGKLKIEEKNKELENFNEIKENYKDIINELEYARKRIKELEKQNKFLLKENRELRKSSRKKHSNKLNKILNAYAETLDEKISMLSSDRKEVRNNGHFREDIRE